MHSKAYAAGGIKNVRKYPTAAQKAALNVAKAKSSQQNRRAAGTAYVRRSVGVGRENLTFDAVTLSAPKTLYCSSDSAVAVSATGYVTDGASAHVVNQVPQGTTSTTRLGRKMHMTGFRLVGRVVNSVTASSYSPVRLALVYIPKLDRTTSTMPPQNVIWTTQDPQSQRVLNNSDRFKVIRSWTWDLMGDLDACSTGKEAYSIDEMIPLDHQTTWTQADTTGVFDNMEEGALCLYVQGIQTVASNLFPRIAYSCRLYFKDM